MTQTLVVDRIEDGDRAVLESSESSEPAIVLPVHWLPEGVSEGDVLIVETGPEGSVRFVLDEATRRARLEEMKARRARLRRGPEGDLSL